MTIIIPDPASAPIDQGHEDATVYRSSAILHPLPGQPRFDGVFQGPAGPMARFTDGDLVLRADLATITAWAAELETARKQLTTTTTDAESEAR